MLNGRLYRAAVLPLLVALAIAAFALTSRPGSHTSTLASDAFEGARAMGQLQSLAASFPDRRPGSAGDEALAAQVKRTLEGLGGTAGGGFSVSEHRFSAQTIDGTRTMTDVIAQRPGSTGEKPLLIVAHRDAAARGSVAELSGTAALLELARVFAARETKRTIVLASTSGGSGGNAGTAQLAGALHGTFDAAIVLGDLAGTHQSRPFVVPYSDGFGSAPTVLQRTLEDAIAHEAGTSAGAPSAIGQLAHLGFPLAPGEQGVLNAGGIPAVLVQVSGERGPTPGEHVSAERLEAFGRAVLSAVDALDVAREVPPAPQTGLQLQRKVEPAWAIRLLVLALLFGPALLAVDGLARVRRWKEPVGRWVLWTLSLALPFLASAVFAYLLGALSIVPAPAVPTFGRAMPLDGGAAASVVAVALVFAVSWLLWGRLVRNLHWHPRPDPEVTGLAMLLVLCGVCAIAWIVNPYAALLAIPALHLWMVLADPELRPRHKGASLGLFLLGLAPLALVAAFYSRQLGLGPGTAAWAGVQLIAGGHVGLAEALLWSVALASAVAAGMLALSVHAPPSPPEAPGGMDITIRGPLTYAGPGSLGGTESALRR